MKRNLMLLNVALLALVCLLGWYVRLKWIEGQTQEEKIRISAVKPPAVPPLPPLKKVQPLDGPAYATVATKNLFSPDRNPTPIPDPPPPPPPAPKMPPLPAAYGVMLWDGLPPTVVLGEPGKGGQKGYHPGDKIGQFTLVSVNNKEIVFDWNGKQITRRLDEIMEKNLVAQQDAVNTPAAAAQPAAAAPAAAALDSNLSANVNGPGKENGGVRMCNPGDTSPPGTTADGYVKKVNTTPFGVTCRWEPIAK